MFKKSVTTVYETNTFSSFLEDVLHPGGLEFTKRVAKIAQVDANSLVLDIACGKGKSLLLLAEEYGCNIVGIDISNINVAQAKARVKRLDNRAKLIVSDAESLPFIDGTFDVVLSECSFSSLPNKHEVALEIKRVLKPGGKLVISDIVKKKMPNYELKGCPFPLIPCLAGARSIEDYMAIFKQAGFRSLHVQDHSLELKKLGYQIAVTFGGWEEFLHQLSAELSLDSSLAAHSVRQYQEALTREKFSYVLIAVSKGPC